MNCAHGNTQQPARPVPDWTGVCPQCGERVKHNGNGGFITVREVNARIAAEQRAVDEFRRRWRCHPCATKPRCHAPQQCPTPDLCRDSEECAWPK